MRFSTLFHFARISTSSSTLRAGIVIRFVGVLLWLLVSVLIVSVGVSSFPALALFLAAALLTFLLEDYFSIAIFAILLTLVVNCMETQVPGTTRAWMVNAIWLGAIGTVAL